MVSLRTYVCAGVAAALLALGTWWHLSRVHAAEKAVHAHYAVILADLKDKTATAATAFRATERAWQKSFEKEAKDGQERLDSARRDADGARTAADGLRKALDRFRATARAAPDSSTAGAGESQQDSSALDLLTGMLARHTGELIEVGAYADQLRAAGLTCERSADSVSN